MTPLVLEGMHGLGDNLYQRAVLRTLGGEVFLETPWPQMYADMPQVRCVRPGTRLRTQAKNAARRDLDGLWHRLRATERIRRRRWHYVRYPGSLLEALFFDLRRTQPETVDFSGPAVAPESWPKPYVVVRPATVRREWPAASRNPRPEYLAQAAEAARSAGFSVISVADLVEGQEWALDPLPVADKTYHAGELPLERLLALVAGAAGLIGGVGWLVPAAVAYQVPLLLIYGGAGGWHGPQRILDRRMKTDRITQALPDAFCRCKSHEHDCNKTITNLEHPIERFIRLAAD